MHITTQIKEALTQLGIKPNKRLGQNFLINTAIYDKIINAVDPKKDDTIIEVGPGLGTLTQYLADSGATIIAVEKDKNLVPYLQDKFASYDNVTIVQDDILKFNYTRYEIQNTKYKVVGNIPYYLTSRLLRIIFDTWPQPQTMVFMMQLEVAQKMIASPPNMTLLSVATQYYADVKIVAKVHPGNFYPEPDVDSAIITLTPHQKYAKNDRFFEVVSAGFSQKRKQLINTIPHMLTIEPDIVEAALKKAQIDPTQRPEQLSIPHWQKLVDILTK